MASSPRWAPRIGSPWRAGRGAIDIVLQPIIDVSSGRIVAAEALARFPGRPEVSAEEVLALAAARGDGPDVEAACVRRAFERRPELAGSVQLSVNVSPDALSHRAVRRELRGDLTGVIIEVTEHAATELDALDDALADLRSRGALIAIDDVSTGYAGLLRLATLHPDIVKLDRSLVTGARQSVEKSAVIESLVSLSRRIGARVLAEGVETMDDLLNLAQLDVDYAQGFAIASPAERLLDAPPAVVAACRTGRADVVRAASLAVPVGSIVGIGDITAALERSVQLSDVHTSLEGAAVRLKIDRISVSTLAEGGVLREISSTGEVLDAETYPLTDFPATRAALESAVMIEAHLSDPSSDPAERELISREHYASLLLTPVIGGGRPLGILEFMHRSYRRWTSDDLNQARILAEHLANVLLRMSA
ncbi:MAG: diguanylate phosphodiesterase [Pseudonocardiales bacterium]|nr:diguanylate phosphodiesterase [Pseudonocardiales bacterium]